MTGVVLVFSLLTWTGLQHVGDSIASDSKAFKEYAELLDREGRLPTPDENYEYSLPPLLPVLGVVADRVARNLDWAPGRPLADLPSPVRRIAWLVLALGALALLVASRRRTLWWLVGLGGAALAAGWAAAYLWSFAVEQPWGPKVLTSVASNVVLIVLAALLAREVWPEGRLEPVLVAAATAALPAVLRIGLVFHPDPLFAVLSLGALLLVLRARRRGWGWPEAVAAGFLLGLAALTRQAAPAVMGTLAAVAIVLGRRAAVQFVAVGIVATLAVAGPWWAYQTDRLGNPIQSNLDRPGYMLDRQPLSFFVSFPPELVTRPYRESFKNELFPKFHAELWSDWFGTIHDWTNPSDADRVLASTQSVLGLVADGLALAGLGFFGVPALRRVLGRRASKAADPVLAALTVFAVLPWLAYVVTLLRFPQADGDPIKAYYLLFLAPVFMIFALCSADWLWRRSRHVRVALVAWLGLYAVSYGGVLWTSF